MEISKQIIEVFDHLAQKFGVVIDWGQQNVIPYIQQLCNKYIIWEIATSIVWICSSIILIIAGIVLLKAARKWHDTYKDKWEYTGMGTAMFATSAVCCWIATLVIVIIQVIDIIRCYTFPELQIIEKALSLGAA